MMSGGRQAYAQAEGRAAMTEIVMMASMVSDRIAAGEWRELAGALQIPSTSRIANTMGRPISITLRAAPLTS